MTKSELVEFIDRDIKEMRDRMDEVFIDCPAEVLKGSARWERLTAGIIVAQRYRLLIKNIEPGPLPWPWRVRYDNE